MRLCTPPWSTALLPFLVLLYGISCQAGNRTAAPDFTLEDATGARVSLSGFRGRTVLVDFWATWCGPCRRTMPMLERLRKKYEAEGLEILAVNIEGRSPNVLSYVQTRGYRFTVLFDPDGEVAGRYGVNGIPRSFLVDREGNLAFAGHPLRLSEDLIEKTLE